MSFLKETKRFSPDTSNVKELLDKCNKHFDAQHSLLCYVKESFFVNGAEVLRFEQKARDVFSRFLRDSFRVVEIHDVRCLIEEVSLNTPSAIPRTFCQCLALFI